MVHPRTPPERRDDLAADRDDGAACRDTAADDRDTVAADRDARADGRDARADRDAQRLDDLIVEVRRQILDRFTRIENAVVDPAGWPDLAPAALAELRAHAAEQRRLAAHDRNAVDGLLTRLRADIHHERSGRVAAARDRGAAARDRTTSGQDRHHAGRDRDRAADDRDQAAIERVQADPSDLDRSDSTRPSSESMADRVARAVAGSRRRIADSRTYLTRSHGHADPLAAPTDAPDAHWS